MSGHFDEGASRRTAQAGYSSRKKVPNVPDFLEHQKQRRADAEATSPEAANTENGDEGPSSGLLDSLKSRLHLQPADSHIEPAYTSQNRNVDEPAPNGDTSNKEDTRSMGEDSQGGSAGPGKGKDTTETFQSAAAEIDPRQKRKKMKHLKRDQAGREVTDPVTHLPVLIHDSTSRELKTVPENEPPPDSGPRASTRGSKGESLLQQETEAEQAAHIGMERLFPPPNFDMAKEKFANVYRLALTAGLGCLCFVLLLCLVGIHLFTNTRTRNSNPSWLYLSLSSSLLLVVGMAVGGGLIWGSQDWIRIQVQNIWDEEVWEAARIAEKKTVESPTPESTQWLNSLLSSIWSLINPDLFASLADTLEDVMQASLPKLVRMVSVEDLGQGSESIRILGIRWLPTGAAARDVSVDGRVKSGNQQKESDRKVPGSGQLDDTAESDQASDQASDQEKNREPEVGNNQQEEGNEENIAEGLEAEEGDFVNLEVAFSYRASRSGKGMKVKAKQAHLYLAFYLPSKIRLPVWVELRGIVGTMRLRLQLCPDPPFFSLCTLTLLGQPKADISCVPLVKKGLNLMDLPLISSFVQSAIDAALAEYVAPKSLTLDLKDMLVGDDFKRDTATHGVLVVRIKEGKGFKEGDLGNPIRDGSTDGYVTVGWAKFGKPVWSTRVIVRDMHPVWDETAFILVGQQELNADERLRIRLRDSDRVSADDDLGKIEVDLKELMHNEQSHSRMWDRQDGFIGLSSDDSMPGSLDWSVGYYPKTRIQEIQLQQQQVAPDVNNMQELKEQVSREVDRKLREATHRTDLLEVDQQKAQDLKVKEDNMITSTPPLEDYPTGILSVQIHQITGLEFAQMSREEQDDGDDTEAGSRDLPSSYCTIILNHQEIYKTRTKPKNAKPFFNAGIERLVRDWRTTEVMVSVRDARIHENDPLIGIIYLPLNQIFRKRSQLADQFPLVGGIGYGRARLSMVFRSIELQAPKELHGWDYGTLEITGPITSKDLASDLTGLRIKLRTSVNHVRMYSENAASGQCWKSKRQRPIRLAVRKRYCSSLVLEFRKNSLGPDKTPAFAVLWLKDIPDEEDRTVTLTVWRGHKALKRAETCCVSDSGEKAGTLEVPLKFFRGLSSYHKRLVSKNRILQEVFEVLGTARDSREIRVAMGGEDDGSGDTSSSSDGEDRNVEDGEKEPDDGKRGPIDQMRDYSKHSEELHRGHRGIMQLKAVRTADWMKTKLEHGKIHLTNNFKHQDREPDVETEV